MAVEAMELKSQEMRKLASELDPLRIGTGWKVEDLEKPQVMIESTYGDSHPGSGQEATAPGIIARISATGKVRERTASITVW